MPDDKEVTALDLLFKKVGDLDGSLAFDDLNSQYTWYSDFDGACSNSDATKCDPRIVKDT